MRLADTIASLRNGVAVLLICLTVFVAWPSIPLVGSPGDAYASEQAVGGPSQAKEEVKGDEAAKDLEARVYQPPPKLKAEDYPRVMGINGRVLVWMAAQLHLWFAAFVLAVPIFVFVIEAIGMITKDERYDKMAYEFIKVSLSAYSVTAIIGGLLAISLFIFYPDFFKYMASIFSPTMLAYAFLFFAESAALYIYYYGWHAMHHGFMKWAHLTVGLILNAVGTTLMFLANTWVSFMMSPHGVDSAGVFEGNIWHAIHNHLWNPINLHRTVANVAYGGSIVGAYAAYRFLTARTADERSHYDWMGYTANLLAVGALLPLPFAGYWLVAEIYSYSQQMGITLMGGSFAWLFITQAVLIGSLFLSANYYLWCGMERSPGAERYTGYIKYIAAVILVCFLVWFTPHTLILKPWELKALGGQYHPFLGPLGIMPAKNTAVNIMLIFTFLSFLLYRRANLVPTVSWAKAGSTVQAAIITAAILNIIGLGAYYGYFTNTVYKVASSVPQVASTMTVMVSCMVIDVLMFKGAKQVGPFQWGKMPARSQYALFLLAVSFTWLMGLMGFIRSGIRQHWHVYAVMRDNSPDAFSPTIGYAAKVVSVAAIIFMAMVIFIFWLSQLSAKKQSPHGSA
jgi:cytochrome bd-type quinol oxidase subunit 1